MIDIEDSAIADGMAVADDGRVSARYGSGHTALDISGQAAVDENARSFEARLIPALHTARSLDEDAAAALSKAAGDLADLAQQGYRTQLRIDRDRLCGLGRTIDRRERSVFRG